MISTHEGDRCGALTEPLPRTDWGRSRRLNGKIPKYRDRIQPMPTARPSIK